MSLNKTPANKKNTKSDSVSKFNDASHHKKIYSHRFPHKGKWVVIEPPSTEALCRKEKARLHTLERRNARYVKTEQLSDESRTPSEDDEFSVIDSTPKLDVNVSADSDSDSVESDSDSVDSFSVYVDSEYVSDYLQMCKLWEREFDLPIRLKDGMQIFLKTLSGKTIVQDFWPTDPILTIKQRIQDVQGVPIKQQRLIYSGKELDDNITLQDYNIENGASIHLLLRLIGGRRKGNGNVGWSDSNTTHITYDPDDYDRSYGGIPDSNNRGNLSTSTWRADDLKRIQTKRQEKKDRDRAEKLEKRERERQAYVAKNSSIYGFSAREIQQHWLLEENNSGYYSIGSYGHQTNHSGSKYSYDDSGYNSIGSYGHKTNYTDNNYTSSGYGSSSYGSSGYGSSSYSNQGGYGSSYGSNQSGYGSSYGSGYGSSYGSGYSSSYGSSYGSRF